MATLTIRDFDEVLKARLRVRAAEHGRSMEAEVRAILADALTPRPPVEGMGSRIRHLMADLTYDEPFEVPRRPDPARIPELPE